MAIGYGALSFAGVGAACYWLRRVRQQAALLGVSAAFIFAAQMVNFPIAAGTSGHLLGGALLVALLGLPGAVVVLSSVLFVQCFVFGDGGVFALGANVFNMGIVSSVVGFCCYRLLCGSAPSPTRRVAAVAFASWLATVAAAASCAEQLALSETARWSFVMPAMLGVHALIGIGEAVITATVVAAVLRFRPELLGNQRELPESAERSRWLVLHGLGLSLAVAVLLAPIAYGAPDGLASVAADLGFQSAERAALAAPLAEYGIPGLSSGLLTTLLAGAFGTLLLFGACWLLALGLVPRTPKAPAAGIVVESS